MRFLADLHVHSKYSRATSRDLDLEHLAAWASRKGIAVVGTGDCVHPAWLAEIREKLVPDGGGLFRLRPDIEAEVAKTLPPSCRRPVRFMLSTEISTIYKKGEKTRKVHHLLYVPDLDAADRLQAALARIGNIASDGRPILGLDSRDLLEITLQSGPDSYLVPAHIWTPWFAAMGSQSGFDSIDECYGDLAGEIFAVETGLSSDPAMNWRIASLDRFRLTSNSDAHSPGKLGREATRFSCEADYFSILKALRSGEGYDGTVEFFPEEGKYHMDGHRACEVRLDPKETIALGGRCPACGRPVTVGVAHRIEMLADREEGEVRPETAGEAESLVPLPEILAELVGSGVASKAVTAAYARTTAALGPELDLLAEVPVEDIGRADPLLGEAVERLRAGTVIRDAGYDGEYGVIRLFEAGELDQRHRGELLFDAPRQSRVRVRQSKASEAAMETPETAAPESPKPSGRGGLLAALDADQARAAAMVEGPLAVIAGPGSGKTRMLTHRIAHLVGECGVPARACLAVTFTRRATEELRRRLAALLGDAAKDCAVESFHSLGLAMLRRDGASLDLPSGFRIADEAERLEVLARELGVSKSRANLLLKEISVLKRAGGHGEGEARAAMEHLAQAGREHGFVDFDDLVALAVRLLETSGEAAAFWRGRFSHVLADEFQDIDERQYRLLRLLAGGGNLCVIGDPDQAIYGFRGADASCFERFAADFPEAPTLLLPRNYRSTATIVEASAALFGRAPGAGDTVRPGGEPVTVHRAADERDEADFVAETIEALLGGHDLLAANRKREARVALGFGDIAVLYRTDAQASALREALDRGGIPHAKSRPAPIADHPGVVALLAALGEQSEADRGPDLSARIGRAAETARQGGMADAADLAEARGWLAALAASGEVDEARLREQIALSNEADFFDPRADRVSLLTMHAAKGLEFPVVFVVGLEDGITPFRFADDDDTAPDEERRLFYVAMTRAKDRVILSRAGERFFRGARRTLPASPFLAAIPPKLTTGSAPSRKRRSRQYSLF